MPLSAPLPRLLRVLVLLVALVLAGAAPAVDPPPAVELPVATLTRFSAAPTLDGKLAPGEWDQALRLDTFRNFRKSMEQRPAVAYVGYTDERLYVAVVSGVSPKGPRGEPAMRDSHVISDSGVELWIDPNQERRAAAGGSKKYYQIMVNPFGALRDMEMDTAGSPNTGWDPDLGYGYVVDMETRTWTAELSIAWDDLGWEGVVSGHQIGLLIARNFKDPWNQTVAMYWTGQGFNTPENYPRYRLQTAEPVVRINSLGEKFWDGVVAIDADILNPGPARTVRVHFLASSDTMPTREETVEVALPAQGKGHYVTQVGGFFHAADQHEYSLTVTDAATGQVYFHNPKMPWTAKRVSDWTVRTEPEPQRACGIRYYPSHGLLGIRVEPAYLGEAFETVQEAFYRVTDAAGAELVGRTRMTWTGPLGEQQVKLGELADGVYSVTVEVPGFEPPMQRQFRRQHYEWENAGAGVTREVYPPFEPMQVQGETVSVVLRHYGVGGLGLWDSIEARGQGRDATYRQLLARPMQVVVDGDRAMSGSGEFIETGKQQVVYGGGALLDNLRVSTRTITEYDGCMKVIMTLAPEGEPVALQSLWLDIPLRDQEVSLMHVCTTATRQNPAGAVPAGEGPIWDTTNFPDGEWYGGFLPYIWLGTESRGLCWFADNDKGWVTDFDVKTSTYKPAFSLHRADGVLTLRVHFVQKPTTLTAPREIVFGLMATPAKPMPADWRRIGRRDYRQIGFAMPRMFGMPHPYAAAYPWNKDWSLMAHHQAQRLGAGAPAEQVVQAWVDRYGEAWRQVTETGSKRGMGVRNNYYSNYFDEFHSTAQHQETLDFWSEWTGREINRIDPPPIQNTLIPAAGTGGIVPSYVDFATWYAAEWLRYGFGIYFDNAFPKRAYDPVTTAAYRLENGKIQPSAGMWNHREYLKRIWVLHQQLASTETPQMMMIHMTNSHVAPYMVWNMSNLDLEFLYGPQPAQAKYSVDFLRAESLGLQSGNIPLAIASSRSKAGAVTPEQQAIADRTRWAALLVHEIKAGISTQPYPEPIDTFGYGLEDCVVYNYWDRDTPLRVSDPQAKTLLLQRNGQLLLLVVTWNARPATLTIGFDLGSLGLTPATAVDAETQAALPWTDATLTLDLPAYGVQLIHLR